MEVRGVGVKGRKEGVELSGREPVWAQAWRHRFVKKNVSAEVHVEKL